MYDKIVDPRFDDSALLITLLISSAAGLVNYELHKLLLFSTVFNSPLVVLRPPPPPPYPVIIRF